MVVASLGRPQLKRKKCKLAFAECLYRQFGYVLDTEKEADKLLLKDLETPMNLGPGQGPYPPPDKENEYWLQRFLVGSCETCETERQKKASVQRHAAIDCYG